MSTFVKPLFNKPIAEDYLNAAKIAADWLLASALKSSEGYFWQDSKLGKLSVYGGNAGIVNFLLHIAKVTGDESYLDGAIQGSRFIINQWNDGKELPTYGDVYNSQWCFYNGATGIAFTLNEVAKFSGEQEFQDFATNIINETINAAIETESGPKWTGDTGVFFDSGIVLFLLYAAKEYKKAEWLEFAVRAGDRILKQGVAIHNSGTKWPNVNPAVLGLPEGSEIPNFFYGTSGVAYTMARLFEESNKGQFLEAALEGAKYIRSIATVKENNILIPYSLPHYKDTYYLGLCHGAVGTARLFYQLYKVTGDTHHKEFVDGLVAGILSTGAPELHSPGYWNVTCQCCGSAGMSNLFIGVWADTKDSTYLDYAARVGDHLLSEIVSDSEGTRWYQAWNRTEPWNVATKMGFFDGTAGNASELLHIYLAKKGEFDVYRLPDDPFLNK
ncbi:lanthionine synthetase LanC family protein [Mesobacillus foraminis]|uniref:lanthionine synthetase LanC family protein n=1 Tax=Mesobacillus foraminis TaxID=279826 RepID=UPI000EF4ADA7|nr:lanthionine synthetase LanC family protein [Mesobacillus foraminis]